MALFDRNPIRILKNRYYVCFDSENRYHITSGENYVWFRIAKSATRSILETLNTQTNIQVDKPFVKFNIEENRHKFKFCLMRNPWDRVVSAYCDKVEGKLLFKECWNKDFTYFLNFLQEKDLKNCDRHIMLQTALFPAESVDFVGKLENLSDDFAHICNKIGITSNLAHKNKSKRKNYQEYYTDAGMKIVSEIYADDILAGNYTF